MREFFALIFLISSVSDLTTAFLSTDKTKFSLQVLCFSETRSLLILFFSLTGILLSLLLSVFEKASSTLYFVHSVLSPDWLNK